MTAQRMCPAAMILFATIFGPAPLARAQVVEQLIFYAVDSDLNPPQNQVHRFDRKLQLLGATSMTALGTYLSVRDGMGVGADGVYKLAGGALPSGVKKVFGLGSDGAILHQTGLQSAALSVRVDRYGTAYALTWGGSFATSDAYAIQPDGSVLWSAFEGPSIYAVPAEHLAITTQGKLWIGGSAAGFSGGFYWTPVIQELDLQTGAVVRQVELPPLGMEPGVGPGDTFLVQLEAGPDGSLWAMLSGQVFPQSVVNADGVNPPKVFEPSGGWNGNTNQMRIDAHGDFYTVSFWTADGQYGGQIRKFSGVDGSLLRVYPMALEPDNPNPQGAMGGFAMGPSGEDMFAVYMTTVPHLVRINLVTGVRSMRRFPNFSTPTIPPGDPTGFQLANVVDQQGDNDGDGHTNREETLAGSNPFRAASRPDGPKVYLSFLPNTNAIVLEWRDPDGLLHPTKGLDLDSLSLVADGYGDILPLLWSFVSQVTISPDSTSAVVEFGLLPIPEGLPVGLEATVKDRTGAEGWDWQVIPPGVLDG